METVGCRSTKTVRKQEEMDIVKLFQNKECTYDFDTEIEMGNIQSMDEFLSTIEMNESNIYLNDGTLVILKHKDFNYGIRLDIGVRGNFCRHRIKTSVYNGAYE